MSESVWDIPCKNSHEAVMMGGCLLIVNSVLMDFDTAYASLEDVRKDFTKMQTDLIKKLSLNEVGKEQLEIIENSCNEEDTND